MKRFLQSVREIGFEGPRVAVALLPLSLFSFLFLLNALLGPPEFKLALVGVGLTYLTAFVALAAGWFWGRWFASGIGWSGAMMAGIGATQPGAPLEILAFIGGLHALVIVMLMGQKLAARYDLQPGWRQRFGMDEFGVARLGKAVTRAGAALPGLIFMAFAPRQSAGSWVALLAAGLAVLGVAGLVRLRAWSLFALAGAAVAALFGAPVLTDGVHGMFALTDSLGSTAAAPGLPGALVLLLTAATLPFVPAAVRFLRTR